MLTTTKTQILKTVHHKSSAFPRRETHRRKEQTKQVQTINKKKQLRFVSEGGGEDTVFLHRSSDWYIAFQPSQDARTGQFDVNCWKLCRDDGPNEFSIGKKENVTMRAGARGPGTIQFHNLGSTEWDLTSVIGFKVRDAFVPCILILDEVTSNRRSKRAHYIGLMDWNCDSGLWI